jgi:rhamnosyltransferase
VIGQALGSLFAQEYRDFELNVVDSGSVDRTLEVVRQFPCRLKQLPAREYFPGVVLNQAIAETRTELLVFQNSDAVMLTPRTLGALLEPFADPAVQAAFARQVPRPEAATWVRRDCAASFPPTGPAPAWMPYALPLAAMRRSIWEQHRFQTDTWGSEDTEWGYRAKRNEQHVRYVPEAVVMHSHNYTLRQLYGRRFIEGEADAFIHRDTQGVSTLVARLVRSITRDVLVHVSAGDGPGLLKLPALRLVDHWAYYRGHKLGERRVRTKDRDASQGQKIVLERYDP